MIARPVKSDQRPWNKGWSVGQKKPLEPKHVWSIRVRQEIARSWRDLVIFIQVIDSKLALLRHFIMRSSGAAFPMYLYSLRVAAPSPEARNRAGGRTSNPNLGGCPIHH
jgi:hypothetical protein